MDTAILKPYTLPKPLKPYTLPKPGIVSTLPYAPSSLEAEEQEKRGREEGDGGGRRGRG